MTTTAPTSPTTSGAPAAPAAPKPPAGRRPRWLAPVIVVFLVIASALAVTVLTRGREANTDDLDPANPGFAGAQGLANVLRDQGVKVTVVRNQRELQSQRIDGATTVVVTSTIRLSGRTARAVMAHASSAAGLLLLDPDTEVTRGMGLPVDSHLTDLSEVAAGCRGTDQKTDPGKNPGNNPVTNPVNNPENNPEKSFRLAEAGRAYTPTAKGSAGTTCFPDRTGGGGAMLTLPGSSGRPPVTLLGNDSLITNGAILSSDNAAIALRLFGPSNRLIWYVPSVADIAAADVSSRSIAPDWFQPGLVLASSAALFLCLWRGRRLGRLVTEPLPVVVRAVETTESRGRMYRRSRDRNRALSVLQLASRRRLAAYLGLSVSSSLSSVAAASAAVSGRTYQDVLDLLSVSEAHDDSSLLERANTLAALEKEVRRP